ncbi:MAG: RNA polymerase sigma factor [Pseudomonadales bacterium]|nr:RNA polymerase sigma factor [Pseudomonadales bacterium]
MTHKQLWLVNKIKTNPEQEVAKTSELNHKKQYVEALFNKYRNPLLHYLTRLLDSSEDATELLQETYIRLLEQKNLEHLEANERAYLFKIATNLVRDKSRRDKARQRHRHEPFVEDQQNQEIVPITTQLDWYLALESLKSIIHELSPRGRRIFILHRFKHMTYKEIANLLGITTRTVERDMSLVMSQCKEKLKTHL